MGSNRGPETWVDARRLSRDELGILLGLGAAMPLGIFVLFVFVYQALAFPYGLAITTGIALLWPAGAMLFVGAKHVRRLGLSDGGIIMVTWFRTAQTAWSEIRPSPFNPKATYFLVRWRKRNGRPSTDYLLSKEQGRALLCDRRAPQSLFPAEAWDALGLAPPWARGTPPN